MICGKNSRFGFTEALRVTSRRQNCYVLDKYYQDLLSYRVDSNLSNGWCFPLFEQQRSGWWFSYQHNFWFLLSFHEIGVCSYRVSKERNVIMSILRYNPARHVFRDGTVFIKMFFWNSLCSDTISSEHARQAIEKAQIGSTGRQLVRNVSNALVCLTR